MGYKQDVRAVKCDTLEEAKALKLGCYGLSISRITIIKDESNDSREYELVDFILSDLDGEKFTFPISRVDIERAMNS